MRRLWLFPLILMLASCSFVSDDGEEHAKLATPDIILEDAEYTLGQSGENPIFIRSSHIEFYSKDERAVTESLTFVQYNEDGEITHLFLNNATGESYTYWLVPDAYTAALGQPRNEVFFPISNFPAALEVGQVFLYDHGLPDGSTERFFYYYDGSQYLDVQVAWGFGADLEPLQIGQTRTLTIAGKDYTAVNQGTTDLSYVFPQYRSRTFWLVRDAYGDVKNLPAIANMLPYDNYPDDVEEGQVWAIEYTLPDGSIQWEYYRADGALYNGRPATTQFEG